MNHQPSAGLSGGHDYGAAGVRENYVMTSNYNEYSAANCGGRAQQLPQKQQEEYYHRLEKQGMPPRGVYMQPSMKMDDQQGMETSVSGNGPYVQVGVGAMTGAGRGHMGGRSHEENMAQVRMRMPTHTSGGEGPGVGRMTAVQVPGLYPGKGGVNNDHTDVYRNKTGPDPRSRYSNYGMHADITHSMVDPGMRNHNMVAPGSYKTPQPPEHSISGDHPGMIGRKAEPGNNPVTTGAKKLRRLSKERLIDQQSLAQIENFVTEYMQRVMWREKIHVNTSDYPGLSEMLTMSTATVVSRIWEAAVNISHIRVDSALHEALDEPPIDDLRTSTALVEFKEFDKKIQSMLKDREQKDAEKGAPQPAPESTASRKKKENGSGTGKSSSIKEQSPPITSFSEAAMASILEDDETPKLSGYEAARYALKEKQVVMMRQASLTREVTMHDIFASLELKNCENKSLAPFPARFHNALKLLHYTCYQAYEEHVLLPALHKGDDAQTDANAFFSPQEIERITAQKKYEAALSSINRLGSIFDPLLFIVHDLDSRANMNEKIILKKISNALNLIREDENDRIMHPLRQSSTSTEPSVRPRAPSKEPKPHRMPSAFVPIESSAETAPEFQTTDPSDPTIGVANGKNALNQLRGWIRSVTPVYLLNDKNVPTSAPTGVKPVRTNTTVQI